MKSLQISNCSLCFSFFIVSSKLAQNCTSSFYGAQRNPMALLTISKARSKYTCNDVEETFSNDH